MNIQNSDHIHYYKQTLYEIFMRLVFKMKTTKCKKKVILKCNERFISSVLYLCRNNYESKSDPNKFNIAFKSFFYSWFDTRENH